jgi:drug/metabolite transporter (DMT)-like permease
MTYIKLLLTAFFWGGTFVAGRMLAGHVAPFAAAFLRFSMASTVLLAVLRLRHGRLPGVPASQRIPILLLGLTGVLAYNALFFWGLQLIPSGRAAVIVANNPVMIAIGAAVVFNHRLGWIKSAGVLVSVTGAAIAISHGNPLTLFTGGLAHGDLLILGCVFSWVCFSLIGKTVLTSVPPLTAVTYAAVAETVMLVLPAVLEGLTGHIGNYTIMDWGNLAYLGVFGTALGFVWYYEGIEKIGPTRAGLFINFVPISAIALAYFILGEPLTWSLATGTVLVVSGVYLTNNGLRPPRKQ